MYYFFYAGCVCVCVRALVNVSLRATLLSWLSASAMFHPGMNSGQSRRGFKHLYPLSHLAGREKWLFREALAAQTSQQTIHRIRSAYLRELPLLCCLWLLHSL